VSDDQKHLRQEEEGNGATDTRTLLPLCIRGHVGEGVDVEGNEETVEEVVSNDLVEGVHAK